MRTVLIIEPVTFAGAAEEDAAYLDGVRERDTVVEVVCASPLESVEGYADEVRSAVGVLDAAAAWAGRCDAMVINCFADPGLLAAREVARVPIVGAAEASVSLALQLGARFGVVAPSAVAAKDAFVQAAAMGLAARFAGAVSVDVPIVDLTRDPEATAASLASAARQCVDQHGADVVVLGCTGMAQLAEKVRQQLDVPLIEPMLAAFKTAESLARLGLVHAPSPLHVPAARDG